MNGKIIIWNANGGTEDYSLEPNNFYIGRTKEGNPLGNPYTFNGKKTSIAKLTCKTREDSIEAFRRYFKRAYGVDEELTKAFDEIYYHYKNGETVYLQCFCKPLPCHGDVIAEELQKKLIRDTIKERKLKR